MGVSCELCFGILFEEYFEFPWNDEKYEGDEEKWWEHVAGFVPSFFPYDEHGEYQEGVDSEDPRVDLYYAERTEWYKHNPFPVTINICGSYDAHETLLCAPDIGYSGSWEDSEVVDIQELRASKLMEFKLVAFCKQFDIDTDGVTQWYLTATKS